MASSILYSRAKHFGLRRCHQSRHHLRYSHSGRAASDPLGPTGRISTWVTEAQLSDVPSALVRRAKYLILDGIGCALFAAHLPWSKTAARAVLSMESPGNCTVIGWNKRVGPLPAALLNSPFIQGFELDDVNEIAPWHANSVVLPALFAAAEHMKSNSEGAEVLTGRDFLISAIIGFELGGRVGLALGGSDMLSRGWHSGAVFGPPAAAAAVSRCLSLQPRQVEDALGTACTQACGLMSAQYEAMAKRMQHGFAARNGLFAALTSQAGYTGIDKVFEREYGGFLSTFGQGSQHGTPITPRTLLEALGKSWNSLESISIKPYASMLGTHGPIDCIRDLQVRFPKLVADPSRIRSVRIEQSKAWFGHGGQDISQPIDVLGAQMSTKYCVASQLVDGSIMPAQFSKSRLNRQSIWDLVPKIQTAYNDTFTGLDGGRTRLTMELKDGTVATQETNGPRTTRNRLTNDEIFAKWRTMADCAVSEKRARRIERMVLDLENLDDISELMALLESKTDCQID